MDDRIVEFVRGLRTAGVRVSMAEAVDAFNAISSLGSGNRAVFETVLRATLIKEQRDNEAFDKLFPIYFQSGSHNFRARPMS